VSGHPLLLLLLLPAAHPQVAMPCHAATQQQLGPHSLPLLLLLPMLLLLLPLLLCLQVPAPPQFVRAPAAAQHPPAAAVAWPRDLQALPCQQQHHPGQRGKAQAGEPRAPALLLLLLLLASLSDG
jgi:hypothetical protein